MYELGVIKSVPDVVKIQISSAVTPHEYSVSKIENSQNYRLLNTFNYTRMNSSSINVQRPQTTPETQKTNDQVGTQKQVTDKPAAETQGWTIKRMVSIVLEVVTVITAAATIACAVAGLVGPALILGTISAGSWAISELISSDGASYCEPIYHRQAYRPFHRTHYVYRPVYRPCTPAPTYIYTNPYTAARPFCDLPVQHPIGIHYRNNWGDVCYRRPACYC
ncbi:hypothetical protein [Endozoicomonas ascidiicola]|uniref:hypothetical protein n=1 Tax=Endozoicomonas ascidiicola TaxID=1698521 RepID=UPI0008366614|nr:hypothetical protein [Endozoicomonas ascidiicola]